MTAITYTSDDHLELLGQFSADFHPLVELGQRIGPEALQALLEVLGGEKPHIPKPETFWASLRREVRNEQIRSAFRGNYTETGEQFGITGTQIRRIIEGARCRRPKSPHRECTVKIADEHMARIEAFAREHDVSLREALDTLLQDPQKAAARGLPKGRLAVVRRGLRRA